MAVVESQGSEIQIGDGASPEVFTKIPQVVSIDGLRGGAPSILNVSNLDSTAQEKRAGLKDEGQVTFVINYDPAHAQHTALETARDANPPTVTNFKVILSDAGTTEFAFAALVTSMATSLGVDQIVQATVTLELTGPITKT